MRSAAYCCVYATENYIKPTFNWERNSFPTCDKDRMRMRYTIVCKAWDGNTHNHTRHCVFHFKMCCCWCFFRFFFFCFIFHQSSAYTSSFFSFFFCCCCCCCYCSHCRCSSCFFYFIRNIFFPVFRFDFLSLSFSLYFLLPILTYVMQPR